MDKAVRNLIQKATQDARRVIEHEYAEQLEGTYEILTDGTMGALAAAKQRSAISQRCLY